MEPPWVIGDFPVPPSGLGFFSGFHPLWTAQRPIGSRFKLEVGEVPTVATNKRRSNMVYYSLQIIIKGEQAIVPQKLWDCDAFQRTATAKGTVPNGHH